ncbi:MAG TPA: protein-glutamate O-methyltransferase CheR [Candidatus Acidoferrales bacterium]|jgi:chemotaxis protein methyltransferase CheR|nr:protein-glutamate O-methyltransferase CheR [Candidatus Acidoferrales bacterium]
MKAKTDTCVTLTDSELDGIRTLIEERSGILLDSSRERFFRARVLEHMSERGAADGVELRRLILASNASYDALLERLLTQETSFFRYPAVYEALATIILPEMRVKKFWENPRTLRIWSAGCATGEEPYSIAIALADALDFAEAWNIEILATDISVQALRHAERGIYTRRSLENVSPAQLETYFSSAGTHFSVRPRIRRWVSFSQMNLAQGVYAGRFDCIFCMNVLIYFSEERRRSLIQRFYEYLAPGGYLLLGHAESLSRMPVKFETVVLGDCILYRRPAAQAAPHAAVEAKP